MVVWQKKNISAPNLSRQHSNLLLLGPLLQILFDGAGNSIPANEMEKRSKQINNEDRGGEIRDKKSCRRQRWFSLRQTLGFCVEIWFVNFRVLFALERATQMSLSIF